MLNKIHLLISYASLHILPLLLIFQNPQNKLAWSYLTLTYSSSALLIKSKFSSRKKTPAGAKANQNSN